MAGPSSAPSLERGKACLRCRKRKMRCDGARPACGQCVSSLIQDCEYITDGPTTSQRLEQNIAQLEARIRDLEGGDNAITLHHPQGNISPKLTTTRRIIESFLDHADVFGFFLHLPRFLDNLRASIPATEQSPIPPALVHTVRLIGILFIDDPMLKNEEPRLLERALQSLSCAPDSTRIIYMFQAEVLLSYYLFHQARKLEGGYHAAAAVSIAVACRLHKIRSTAWSVNRTNTGFSLPPPVDSIEEGERIRGFWTILVLDRCWTVWMQSPSVLIQEASPSMQIDTPWPMDMNSYEQLMPQGNTGARTIRNFLDGLTTENHYQSPLALRSKASILYEKACQLAGRWNPSLGSADLSVQVLALDNRIEQFRLTLPSLNYVTNLPPDRLRCLLVIYTLCYCATLQLHEPLDPVLDIESSRTLAAANAAVDLLRVINAPALGHVDPILGVLWGSAGQILVTGLTTVRQTRASAAVSPTFAVSPAEIALTASLNSLLEVMHALKDACPLISEELTKLHSSIVANRAGVL